MNKDWDVYDTEVLKDYQTFRKYGQWNNLDVWVRHVCVSKELLLLVCRPCE